MSLEYISLSNNTPKDDIYGTNLFRFGNQECDEDMYKGRPEGTCVFSFNQ